MHAPTPSSQVSGEAPDAYVKQQSRAEPVSLAGSCVEPRGIPQPDSKSSSHRVLGAHLYSCQPLQCCHPENGEWGAPGGCLREPTMLCRENVGWTRHHWCTHTPTCTHALTHTFSRWFHLTCTHTHLFPDELHQHAHVPPPCRPPPTYTLVPRWAPLMCTRTHLFTSADRISTEN